MMVTPFPILRRYSRFDLPAPVFSGRQLLWSGREVKRLRDKFQLPFSARPGGARKYTVSLSSPGMTTRASLLGGGFPGGIRTVF
jgi:hypothetical protein